LETKVKSTAGKHEITGKAAPGVIMERPASPGATDRLDRIAAAAYYRAERRGFVPGQELDDWLDAEAEFNKAEGH
jgi:hypothetical protein